MIERVAQHQSRFRAPGLSPDVRGVALGPLGVVLVPSMERLVALLRALGEDGALDELLDALRIIQGSELFDEGLVQQVWKRYMGGPIAIEAPELRIKLMQFVRANDYSVPKLVREIVTSSAYAATYEVR